MSTPKRRAPGTRGTRLPTAATLTAADVRTALQTLDAPTWETLARHLKIGKGAAAHRLRRLLRGLEHAGEVRRDECGAYALDADALTVVDEVVEAEGLLKLRDSGAELPATAGVRPGDRVEARRGPQGLVVQRIVEPASAPIIGLVVEGWRGKRFVESLDPVVKGAIDLEADDGTARDGDIVAVRLLWGSAPRRGRGRGEGRTRFAGRIVRVLETRNEADRAATAMLASHAVPVEWPAEVPQAAPREVTAADTAGRLDLTHLPFVTIDGADAKDFDDAVFAERRRRGGWRLVVAIADVAHYVPAGSALDVEARRRGNSVYLPDRVIPMLPEALSNGICSLKPDEKRLALVCDMQVSEAGRIGRHTFAEAVIRSQARLRYSEVAAMLKRGAANRRPRGGAPSLAALHEVHQALRRQRDERGALDLDAHETVLTLRDGRVASISPATRNDAHRLIEEAMIAANVCAARQLEQLGALYRIHEAPSGDKRLQLADALALGGVRLGATPLTPKSVQAAFGLACERSALPHWILTTMLLRSLPQARYDPENRGHFGLALPKYVHFTSPIRRYADLVVHRIIKAGAAPPPDWLAETAMHISMTERRADDVSRAVADWLKCDFIAHRVGERFAGTVVGVTEFGLFVELDGVGVQGLAHISRLGSDYFHFVPASMSLVGERSGRRYTLGDALVVELEEVSVAARRVGLAIVRRASKRR